MIDRPTDLVAQPLTGPSGTVRHLPWLIDGELVVGTGPPHTVLDPASRAAVGTVSLAGSPEVDRAVRAAHAAGGPWAADVEARPGAMRAAAEVVERAEHELASLLTREQGKPLPEATREIARLVVWLRAYAEMANAPEVIRDDPARQIVVVRRPLGVVAAITPWNFPISLLGWKLAPALVAGNTIVIRPSLSTPLTTLRLGELLAPCFPAGVINVLATRADMAAALVAHPLVRKIGFTGSTETGREIMRVAGPLLKRVTLELGGNDPAVVLDDADVDAIEERLFWSAFTNCGQVCIAIKRLYVPESLAERLVDRLADRAASTVMGHGLAAGVQLGPVINAVQRDRVSAYVGDARSKGARVIEGPAVPDAPGFFHPPTIVASAAPGMRLVDEEQFGPALPIITYRDLETAVRAAGEGPFGLGASIWTSDPGRAAAIADRLDVGTVWVGHHGEAVPDAPFGGARDSGLGYENGLPGLEAYTQLQTRNERRD